MELKTEKTDILVKVPVNELKFLEDQQFFGKSKDEWLSAAIHAAIITELNNLAPTDLKKVRALEQKYSLAPREPIDF